MSIGSKTNFKKSLVNLFGVIGYFFCTLSWLWSVILYTSSIEDFSKFITPNASQQVANPPVAETVDLGANLPLTIITAAITIAVIALTVYLLIKMPSTVVKTSKKVVHEVAETATPVVLHFQHKEDSKKSHKRLKSGLIIAMKIVLVVAPVVLTFTSQFIEKQMIDFSIAMYASFWLAGFCLVSFVIQYLLAKLLSVSKHDIA